MEKNKTQNKIWIYFIESIRSSDAETLKKYGMQLALSYKMDISFVSLCAFSEIYVMQKRMTDKNSKRAFGTVIEFYQRFSDETSRSILYRHVTALKTKRLITQQRNKIYRIPENVMKNLEKYNKEFHENLKWQKQIEDVIDDKAIKNSKILKLAGMNEE